MGDQDGLFIYHFECRRYNLIKLCYIQSYIVYYKLVYILIELYLKIIYIA